MKAFMESNDISLFEVNWGMAVWAAFVAAICSLADAGMADLRVG
jgi:hypothetical protein